MQHAVGSGFGPGFGWVSPAPHRREDVAARVRDGGREHVVEQRLLVGVGEVGRPRPRHVLGNLLRVEGERADPADELAQHPRLRCGTGARSS
eukprot:2954125-Prymnesium_polylepis.1